MRATPKITVDTPIGADVDLEAEDVRTSTGRRLTDTVVDELVELNEFVDHGVGKASSGAGTYILGFKVYVGPDGRVHSDLGCGSHVSVLSAQSAWRG